MDIAQLLHHGLRPADIPILRLLVTAAQQNDNAFISDGEIQPVSRAMVNPQFADGRTD
jgi:hypothetical protein